MQYLNFLMNEWPGKNDYTMKVSAEFFFWAESKEQIWTLE